MHLALPARTKTAALPAVRTAAGSAHTRSAAGDPGLAAGGRLRAAESPDASKEITNLEVVEPVPMRYRATVRRSRSEAAVVEFDAPPGVDQWSLATELANALPDEAYVMAEPSNDRYDVHVASLEVIGEAGAAAETTDVTETASPGPSDTDGATVPARKNWSSEDGVDGEQADREIENLQAFLADANSLYEQVVRGEDAFVRARDMLGSIDLPTPTDRIRSLADEAIAARDHLAGDAQLATDAYDALIADCNAALDASRADRIRADAERRRDYVALRV